MKVISLILLAFGTTRFKCRVGYLKCDGLQKVLLLVTGALLALKG